MEYAPCVRPVAEKPGHLSGHPNGPPLTASKLAGFEEVSEERCRLGGNSHDLVGRLSVKFEIELGFRAAVIPTAPRAQFASPQPALGKRSPPDVNAHSWCLSLLSRLPCHRVAEVTTPAAISPDPPSFSLAKMKMVSPTAICLPPYIVFCAGKLNVIDRGFVTAALMANASGFISSDYLTSPLRSATNFLTPTGTKIRRQGQTCVTSKTRQRFSTVDLKVWPGYD